MSRLVRVPAPPEVPAEALLFAVRGRELVIVEEGGGVGIPRLGAVRELAAEAIHHLGCLGGRHCYAAALGDEADLPQGTGLMALRPLMLGLDEELAGVAGLAFQIVDWERTHRFCGACATPTELVAGERAKRCPACGLLAFPRVAPAVIARVTRGDEILLARGRRFPDPVYSVLAGFVDPGESLEQTVARELEEEVGIEVEDVRYFASQPWPFPHSLMVGFTARWAGGDLRVDPVELVDAGWFSRDALPLLPPPLSIARRLIDDWVAPADMPRGQAP
ncbi:MAG: NAD(+) diphosphatase [Thermoleophilia bacterium]|nr:NAD(+) diphosphatase [Thermoleophilia bacterium]